MGFEITEGPFQHKSPHSPVPLSELEEALLVAAGAGVTGMPLWDMARPSPRAARSGRSHGSTSGGRRTALFFTNDEGVYIIDASAVATTKVRAVDTPNGRARTLDLYRRHRKKLGEGRLEIPRRIPPLFAHDFWDSNRPGSTLFMPVCDVSEALISLTANLLDAEAGRYVKGQGGGMYVVDDRHGFRPAGIERWAASGFLDRKKILPLSVLERQACYFMFAEPALICQNIFLVTEALGIGGWMYCGFLSLQILETLGFRMVTPTAGPALVNPVGLDGALEGCCPPYFPDMNAAVDAVASRRREGSADPERGQRAAPYLMSEVAHDAGLSELSDEGLACTKAVCNYIHETYGRFPGTVDTMHLMWMMQAHHLDVEFYDRFFKTEALGPTHRAHREQWHS